MRSSSIWSRPAAEQRELLICNNDQVECDHEIAVLGPLEVKLEGFGSLPINGARKRSLLSALVLGHNRVCSTGELTDAVWGRDAPSKALPALRVHVSHLRKMLQVGEPGVLDPIETVADGYRLLIPKPNLDIWRFENLIGTARAEVVDNPGLAVERLTEALSLWRNEPYPDLVDVPAARGEIERLSELNRLAVEELVDAQLALGQHSRLVARLEKLAEEEPLRERRWGQLMMAHYRSGHQAAALESFQRARAYLVEELGVEPGIGLRELEGLILDQHHTLQLRTQSERLIRRELVGRDQQRSRLEELAKQALGGTGCVVIVSGEAGIGKSALAADLCDHSSWREFEAARADFQADSVPASWPILNAIEVVRLSLEQLVTENVVGPEATTEEIAQKALIDELVRLSDITPVALLLEDLHNADDSTVRLLNRLARRIKSAETCPLLVVATYRSGESVDPQLAFVDAHHLVLEPLTHAQLAAFVEAEAGIQLTEREVVIAADRSGGVPLLLTAMCSAGTVEGILSELPPSMPSIVVSATARLRPEDRRILQAAAVLGESFSIGRLAQLTSSKGHHLFVSLDAISATGMLAIDGPNCRFMHGLMRDAVLASLNPSTRATLHDGAAVALEALPLPDPGRNASELARHAVGALGIAASPDQSSRAHRASFAAATRALHRGVFREAALHFANSRLALIHLGPANDEGKVLDMYQAEADAHMSRGAIIESLVIVEHVISRSRDRHEPFRFADAVLTLSLETTAPGGQPANTQALVSEALELLGPGDSQQRVRLLVHTAADLVLSGRSEHCLTLATEAFQMARRLADPLLLSESLTGLHQAYALSGNPLQRLAWANEAVGAAEHSGNKRQQVLARIHQLRDLVELGDRAEADIALRSAALHAELAGDARFVWAVKAWETFFQLVDGKYDAAERTGAEALAVWGTEPHPDAVVCHLTQLTMGHLMNDHFDAAVDLITGAVSQRPDLPVVRIMLALALAARGQVDLAEGQLAYLGGDPLESLQDDPTRLLSLGMLAELAVHLETPSWLSRLSRELEVHVDQHIVVNVLGGGGIYWGSIHHHLGGVQMLLGDSAEARSSLLAGLESHTTFGAVGWQQRSRSRLIDLAKNV